MDRHTDRHGYMDIKTERYVDRRTDRCRYVDRQTGTRHKGVGVRTYGQPKVHGQIEVRGQTDRQGYTAIRPATGAWARYRRAQTDRRTQTDSAPCFGHNTHFLGISAGLPGKARLAATRIAQEAPKTSLFGGNFTTCKGPRLSFGVFPHAGTANPTGTLR